MAGKKAISFAIHQQSYQQLYYNEHIQSLIEKGVDYAIKNGCKLSNHSFIKDMTEEFESLLDEGEQTTESLEFAIEQPSALDALNNILDRISEVDATKDSILIIDSFPIDDKDLLPVLMKLKNYLNFYTPIDDKLHTDLSSYENFKESLKLTSKYEAENRSC